MNYLKKFESKKSKNVLILNTQSGDWEALYIDNNLISEGHHLGNGDILYMLKMSEKYLFSSLDVRIKTLNDIDEQYTNDYGNMYSNLKDFDGNY